MGRFLISTGQISNTLISRSVKMVTGQLKLTVSGQRLFDPSDGATDGAFRATIVGGDVFHRAVFSIVL
jgi:hypothetical protein